MRRIPSFVSSSQRRKEQLSPYDDRIYGADAGFVETYGEEIDNLDVYELLESYGELYYKGKIKRLSFYKNHHVLKEGNIRKPMQWLWG